MLLEFQNVTKRFLRVPSGFRRKAEYSMAVDDVHFGIREGEIFGLVGESGSGKSTIARIIVKLLSPEKGRILFDKKKVLRQSKAEGKIYRKQVQMVFQNPFESLNPRQTVASILEEGVHLHFSHREEGVNKEAVRAIVEEVGLPVSSLQKYPHEFSGGQRQRIAIARALILAPKLLILDEPVSSLDVSIQSQILTLLRGLKKKHGMTFLFISHDLHIVRDFCDRVAVLRNGKIVETGETKEIFDSPKSEFTKELLDAVFRVPNFSREEGK